MLTAIGLIGTLLSCTVIYLLLYRKVRLAKCQSLFIINLSISDVLVSILGVFRGLGIIDSKFIGAADNKVTIYCVVYSLILVTFGASNVMALLPLTIDRAVAVIFPLRHGSIITHKRCAVMFGTVWLPIVIALVTYSFNFKYGTILARYSIEYHRCILSGKIYVIKTLFLFIIPFAMIVLMYGSMLLTIAKTKRSLGRFLVLSTAIVGTNLLCFTPTLTNSFMDMDMSYMTTQILFVTIWYLNGIFNPLIYFLFHPKTRDFLRSGCTLARVSP